MFKPALALITVLLSMNALASCLQDASAWLVSKGDHSASPKPLAQKVCEGAARNHSPVECLEAAFNWTTSSLQVKLEVATIACAGESLASEMVGCLNGAWSFFTLDDLDFKRYLTAKACSYATPSSQVSSCLSSSWNYLSPAFQSQIDAREVIAEQCQDQKRFYFDGINSRRCWRYDENLNPLYEVDKSQCPFIYVSEGELLPIVEQEGRALPIFREVLSLKDQEAIPAELVKKENLTKLATSMVARRYLRQQISSPSNSFRSKGSGINYFNFKQDTFITMFFRDEIIEPIIKNGFLNHHQTGTSTGSLSGESYEAKLTKISVSKTYGPKEDLSHYLRPKYAYLMFKNPIAEIWPSKLSDRYGNVAAVFKDHIKSRSTFTPDNSYLVQDAEVLTFATKVRFPLRASKAPDAFSGHHWEVQIYGPLTVEKDVDYFLINCPHAKSISPEGLQLLIATGKPIYHCKRTKTGVAAGIRQFN